MRAVILGAGEGTRLRPHTDDRPKCLVELAGRPLLAWQLDALAVAGIDDVTIVTGYRADQIVGGTRHVHNPRFDTTNMVASLMCARDALDGTDDVLIAYSDIVYEPRLVQALMADDAEIGVLVDRSWRDLWELRMSDPLTDAETLKVDPDGRLRELGRRPTSYDDVQGQYVGLIRVGAAGAPRLAARYDALDPAGPFEGRDRDHMFMTAFLQLLIDDNVAVHAVTVDGGWVEIDTCEDLDVYSEMYGRGELDRFVRLEGGGGR